MGRPRKIGAKADEECNVARIRLHYERLGLREGWDLDRVWRLCRLLHCTERELCALANMSPSKVSAAIHGKRFGPEASLHFALLERSYLDSTGARGEEVMPLNLLRRERKEPHD